MATPRVGLGYDIHRLAAGRRLVLGGVAIEQPTGLVGHSDGDVLLHPVMDAVLGASGVGGLGSPVPGADPEEAGGGRAGPVARGRCAVRQSTTGSTSEICTRTSSPMSHGARSSISATA